MDHFHSARTGRGSREREDFEDGTANKDIYKISQCVTSALMMQIAEYCTCYLSYITDIHRYVNSTGLSGIGFTPFLSERRVLPAENLKFRFERGSKDFDIAC